MTPNSYPHFLNSFSQKSHTIQNILQLFALGDVIATLFLGTFSILSPNVTIAIQKEPLVLIIIFIGVVTFIILSFKPFITSVIYNAIRFVIIISLTLMLFYSIYSLSNWYGNAVEGFFNNYIISAKKTASFEDKIALYNTMTQQFIEKTSHSNIALAEYLNKSPSVLNPSTVKIMQTSYQDITALADQNISLETIKYAKHMENMKILAEKATPSYSYTKLIVVSAGTLAVIAIGYYLYSSGIGTKLTDLLAKGFNSVVKTQEYGARHVLQAQKDARMNADADIDTSNLSLALKNATIGIDNNIKRIKEINDILTENVENIIEIKRVVNQVIRPCLQGIYRGLEAVDANTATTVLYSFNIEQQQFIVNIMI